MVDNGEEIETVKEKMKEYEGNELYIEIERSYKISCSN